MSLGPMLGRAAFALVDALAAGALAALLVWFVVPGVIVSSRIELALLVGGAVTGVLLAVALALARMGQAPFPATKVVKRTFDVLPLRWLP